jgi:hypothetical protein
MRADVFISHASEDKPGLVQDLAHTLRELGAEVWFDEFTLQWGDSLLEKVDEGLKDCRYGIIVLSPAFFRKPWPRRELNALATRELVTGEKVMLPIWHEVGAREVFEHSPALADRVALDSSIGVVEMAHRALTLLGLEPAAPEVDRATQLWTVETSWLLPELVLLKRGVKSHAPKSTFSSAAPATECKFVIVTRPDRRHALMLKCVGPEPALDVRYGYTLGRPETRDILAPGESVYAMPLISQDDNVELAATWTDSTGRHITRFEMS